MVIVFLSDHGEEFHDHGQLGHCARLYEELIHVPLILKLAGPEAPRGVEVQQPVRSLDLYPTLARLLDLEVPQQGLQGVDLAPTWRGESLGLAVIAEETQPPSRCYLEDEWKLILADVGGGPPRRELYHLREDPYERRNRVRDDASIADRLFARLESTIYELKQNGFRVLDDGGEAVLTADVRRALEMLGYTGEE